MDAPAQPRQADYLEGLMEGFVAYDAGWRMTYMNASAERLLGKSRSEVLGKTMYQRVKGRRVPERMEILYPHYGRWMEISASPLAGWGQEEDQLGTRAAGFDAHLVKPVAHEALLVLLSTSGRE